MVRYVLDACALIALLNKEDGADRVATLYEEAIRGEAELFMSKVNLLEVYYGYLKEDGDAFAEQQFMAVEKSAVKINEVISNELLRQAGKIKCAHKRISLADSFAVAQAVVSNAVLVTADHHELDAIDKAGLIEFLWIR